MTRSPPAPVAPRSVLRAAGLALGLALLLGFWPAPKSAYPGWFHAHGTPILQALTGRPVRFEASAPNAASEVDSVLYGYEPGRVRPAWTARFSLVRIGYWPSVVLLALLFATPMRPLRRALALPAGLLLLDAFTLGRIAVEIHYAYFELAHGPGQAVQGPLHLLLRIGSESLTASIPSGAAVLGLWVLLADPRHGLALGLLGRWLGRAAPATGAGAPDTGRAEGGACPPEPKERS